MNLFRALDVQRGEIVAFVGAGGKTASLLRLAGELAAAGAKVLTTTTTKMARREIPPSVQQIGLGAAQLPPAMLANDIQTHGHVFLYQKISPGEKLKGLRADWFDQHIAAAGLADVILVEADGARRLPFKGPYSHEPVIPASATIVVPVVGLDVIGQPLDEEHVYGADMIAATTGQPEGQPVTPELVATVLDHPELGLKSVPESARVIALLNKVETQSDYDAAQFIAAQLLRNERFSRVLVGAVQNPDPILEIHRRVGAVILAAGRSTRMQQNKMLLPWGSTTVIGQVAQVVSATGLPVAVVVGHDGRAVEGALSGLPVDVIHNPDYTAGEMLSSLQMGLQALVMHGVEACLVCLGDLPGIQPEVIAGLLQAYREGRGGIIAPSYEMRRGHPIVIDRRYWNEILSLPPGGAPRDVIRAHENDIYHLVVDTPSVVRDLDTPEDYQNALDNPDV